MHDTSATEIFSLDSKWERQYLRDKVVPTLRRYCQRNALQFHAVDLHHGVTRAADSSSRPTGEDVNEDEGEEEAKGEEDEEGLLFELEREGALELGLREIQLCLEVSAGPSFIVSPQHWYEEVRNTLIIISY